VVCHKVAKQNSRGLQPWVRFPKRSLKGRPTLEAASGACRRAGLNKRLRARILLGRPPEAVLGLPSPNCTRRARLEVLSGRIRDGNHTQG
jgi:hypothetical protein